MKISTLTVAGAMVAILVPATVDAQSLSNGDYALCEVTGRDGRFIGYDSVCLESRRAALRGLQADRFPPPRGYDRRRGGRPVADHSYPSVYFCPIWANNGNGFSTMMSFHYGPMGYSGTFDAPVNGNPCVPRPVYILPGFR